MQVAGIALIALFLMAMLGWAINEKSSLSKDYPNMLFALVVLFLPGLYLFRKGRGTKRAVSAATSIPVTKVNTPTPSALKFMPVVRIGQQEWMGSNLNTDRFRNGDLIPEAPSREAWIKAGLARQPAWCYHDNDPSFGLVHGKLYNWYAVSDARGLLPESWRLPSERDWYELCANLGGRGSAGLHLKSKEGWNSNGNGLDDVGFEGQPSGGRIFENATSPLAATFTGPGQIANWWCADEETPDTVWVYSLIFMSTGVSRLALRKEAGMSVRGVR